MYASVVTLVNNGDMYKKMVRESLPIEDFQCVPIVGAKNASKGLNEGIERADCDLVICCHQDVWFPPNWKDVLTEQLSKISNMGVVGTFGKGFNLKSFGEIYNPKPHLWSSGPLPCQAMSLDEHCLIIKKSSGLRFDETNPYFHLYGGDLCLESYRLGYTNWVIESKLEHLSPKGAFDESFAKAVEWLIAKWKGQSPITRFVTMCMEVNFETGSWHHYF